MPAFIRALHDSGVPVLPNKGRVSNANVDHDGTRDDHANGGGIGSGSGGGGGGDSGDGGSGSQGSRTQTTDSYTFRVVNGPKVRKSVQEAYQRHVVQQYAHRAAAEDAAVVPFRLGIVGEK